MNSDRIKEIQAGTAYPESVSVHQALLQVWNECEQEHSKKESEYICLCGKEPATHSIGQRKTLCSKCWNKILS